MARGDKASPSHSAQPAAASTGNLRKAAAKKPTRASASQEAFDAAVADAEVMASPRECQAGEKEPQAGEQEGSSDEDTPASAALVRRKNAEIDQMKKRWKSSRLS